MDNLYLILFSLYIFIFYNTYTYFSFGLLPSISDSYYHLDKKYNMIFTFFIWFFIIPIMIVGSTPLLFFAGAFIGFVGASPKFREKTDKHVHNIGAIGGILFSILSLIFDFKLWYVSLFLIVTYIVLNLLKYENKIYVIEVLTFLIIIFVLIYYRILV